MSESQFWPVVQPLDDTGAAAGDGGDADFGLQTLLGADTAPPPDTSDKLKSILHQTDEQSEASSMSQSKKDLVSKANKLKKEMNDAFPLMNRSLYYSKLLRKSGEKDKIDVEEQLGSYVALDPAQRESIAVKQKELLLNDKLMKSLESSMAGDQAHVIEARVGKRTLKKQKKVQREKTEGLGAAWFGMKAPEVTEEVQRDLEVLKMRGAIDPKRFYKKTGTEGDGLPKYFQIGQVVSSAADYYSKSGGGGGKNKKRSLVDELMADAEYQKFSKRKYAEIVDEKAKLDPRNRHKKHKKKLHS